MPYNSNNELPDYVKKYSEKIQSQFRHVFNTVWAKLEKEKVGDEDKEARAFKAANTVLKKRFTKKDSLSNNTHADYFNYLVDNFEGKI